MQLQQRMPIRQNCICVGITRFRPLDFTRYYTQTTGITRRIYSVFCSRRLENINYHLQNVRRQNAAVKIFPCTSEYVYVCGNGRVTSIAWRSSGKKIQLEQPADTGGWRRNPNREKEFRWPISKPGYVRNQNFQPEKLRTRILDPGTG